MKISFFEEFPSKNNLNKLKLIKFPTTIYIAAKSFKDFEKIKKKIRARAVYWPILSKKEGYWISPFSDYVGLKRIFSEIPKNQEVMLDLEPPFNRWLVLKGIFTFSRNKKIIQAFINSHKVILCENFLPSSFLKLAGLSYVRNAIISEHPKNLRGFFDRGKKIKMAYTSMNPLLNIKKIRADKIGIGCIAKGIYGNEKILSPEELERDLKILQKSGKEVVIFRLGGLNKEYVRIIEKVL